MIPVSLRRSLVLVAAVALSACGAEDEPEPAAPEVPESDYCAPVSDWDPEWSALEDEVVEHMNERRAEGATCGDEEFGPAEPLTTSPELRCASRIHAVDMGVQDYFSNLDPEMVDFFMRAELAGYAGTALEQNIGAGHHDAERLVDAMMGSTGLCANVMDPAADEVGVGWVPPAYDDALTRSYWTMVFGAG